MTAAVFTPASAIPRAARTCSQSALWMALTNGSLKIRSVGWLEIGDFTTAWHLEIHERTWIPVRTVKEDKAFALVIVWFRIPPNGTSVRVPCE